MSDPSELDPRERAALAAWDGPAPPDGFADRVLAARTAAPAPVAPARPGLARWIRRPAVITGVACAAALALWLGRGGGGAGAQAGALVAQARTEAKVGGRATAVAEPGAALAWTVKDGVTAVDQSAGSVFYRVEHGGPFVVATPAGVVRVTGTCFRVEVIMRAPVQGIIGAAIGAAVVVTVYEGRVLFADARGHEAALGAGESARVDGPGDVVVRRGPGAAGDAPTVAMADAPPADLSRDDLLARDRAQRGEIALLRGKLAALEHDGAGGPGPGGDQDADGRPWFDPSKESLARFAKDCRVRLDLPPIMNTEPFEVGAEMAKRMDLSEAERGGVNQVFAAIHAEYVAALRQLYAEVTGAEAGEDLSPEALASELRDKSPPEERARVQKLIALERAGLATPPANLAGRSPYERYFRLLAGLGDHTEEALGAVVGRDRAHALRARNGGWGMRQEMAGCPDQAGQADDDANR